MPGLNELFYFVFQGLAFFGGVAGILVVPAPFAAVGIFWAQGPLGRWYQLSAQGLLQNFAPISIQRRVAGEAKSSVVPFLVSASS